jgi:hypothetical protein
MLPTGKIIPQTPRNGGETTGTDKANLPFHLQHEIQEECMYIGLGGILVLILILWLLGVI